MIVNFRIREINQDTYKLIRTPTLKKKKKKSNHARSIYITNK
jgi:hypothetical protein